MMHYTASGAEIHRVSQDLYQITEPFTGNTCYLIMVIGQWTWRAQTLPVITGSGHGEILGQYGTLQEAFDCL